MLETSNFKEELENTKFDFDQTKDDTFQFKKPFDVPMATPSAKGIHTRLAYIVHSKLHNFYFKVMTLCFV